MPIPQSRKEATRESDLSPRLQRNSAGRSTLTVAPRLTKEADPRKRTSRSSLSRESALIVGGQVHVPPVLPTASPGAQLLYRAQPIFFGRPFRAAPVLPQLVGECRDLLLLNIVSRPGGAMLGLGLLMFHLRKLVGLVRMLHRLPGALMSGQMVLRSVVFRPGAMSVGRQVMMLSSYLL